MLLLLLLLLCQGGRRSLVRGGRVALPTIPHALMELDKIGLFHEREFGQLVHGDFDALQLSCGVFQHATRSFPIVVSVTQTSPGMLYLEQPQGTLGLLDDVGRDRLVVFQTEFSNDHGNIVQQRRWHCCCCCRRRRRRCGSSWQWLWLWLWLWKAEASRERMNNEYCIEYIEYWSSLLQLFTRRRVEFTVYSPVFGAKSTNNNGIFSTPFRMYVYQLTKWVEITLRFNEDIHYAIQEITHHHKSSSSTISVSRTQTNTHTHTITRPREHAVCVILPSIHNNNHNNKDNNFLKPCPRNDQGSKLRNDCCNRPTNRFGNASSLNRNT